MAITVAAETPLQDDVRQLVGELNATLLAITPPEFCFHMTAEQMAQPDTTVFLAREDGVAVACGALRRHAERTADWALDAVQKWHGKRMERPSRERAKIIARARAGEPSSAVELTQLLRHETNAFWRAVSANLLKRWVGDKLVNTELLASTKDPDPLVSWRILRDWTAAQMAIVETRMVKMDQVFLSYAIARDGRTLYEAVKTSNLLSAPQQ